MTPYQRYARSVFLIILFVEAVLALVLHYLKGNHP